MWLFIVQSPTGPCPVTELWVQQLVQKMLLRAFHAHVQDINDISSQKAPTKSWDMIAKKWQTRQGREFNSFSSPELTTVAFYRLRLKSKINENFQNYLLFCFLEVFLRPLEMYILNTSLYLYVFVCWGIFCHFFLALVGRLLF